MRPVHCQLHEPLCRINMCGRRRHTHLADLMPGAGAGQPLSALVSGVSFQLAASLDEITLRIPTFLFLMLSLEGTL